MCSSNPVDYIAPGLRQTTKAVTGALMPEIPQIPAMPAPPMGQDEKAPDASALRRRRPMVSSTLLTGPAGVTASALNTGAPTLLGG